MRCHFSILAGLPCFLTELSMSKVLVDKRGITCVQTTCFVNLFSLVSMPNIWIWVIFDSEIADDCGYAVATHCLFIKVI